jgi:hypothetical protein
VLAASFEVEHPPGTIAAHNPPNRVEDLLTKPQRRFLSDCAAIRINIDALTVLPPIAATRWRTQSTSPDPEFDIVAERWTVANAMTFLEFSIRVPAAGAGRGKAGIRAATAGARAAGGGDAGDQDQARARAPRVTGCRVSSRDTAPPRQTAAGAAPGPRTDLRA